MQSSSIVSWMSWRTSLHVKYAYLKVACCLEVMCLSIFGCKARGGCAAESPQDCISKISEQSGKVSKVSMFKKMPGNEPATRTRLEDECAC